MQFSSLSRRLLTKTVFVSGKYRKQSNNREFAKNMTNTFFFHVTNVKFDCLNVLLKSEKGKIFCKIRTFCSIEFFKAIIVTDRKYSVADNIVLATIIYRVQTSVTLKNAVKVTKI